MNDMYAELMGSYVTPQRRYSHRAERDQLDRDLHQEDLPPLEENEEVIGAYALEAPTLFGPPPLPFMPPLFSLLPVREDTLDELAILSLVE